MGKHLIEEAYEIAIKKFGTKNFTFKDLYLALDKDGINVKNNVGELYVEMIQDIRFLSLGKQLWSLRENFTRDKIKKISSAMFGLDEYLEEDADKYMSKLEKKELFSKKEDDNIVVDNEDIDDSEIDTIKKSVIGDEVVEIIDENDIIDSDNSFIDSDDSLENMDEESVIQDVKEEIEKDK